MEGLGQLGDETLDGASPEQVTAECDGGQRSTEVGLVEGGARPERSCAFEELLEVALVLRGKHQQIFILFDGHEREVSREFSRDVTGLGGSEAGIQVGSHDDVEATTGKRRSRD